MANRLTAYLAPEGFEAELKAELKEKTGSEPERVHGRLMISEATPVQAAWAANIWHDATLLPVKSIGDAAKRLRELHPRWAPYSLIHHRRMALIQEQLPKLKTAPLDFLAPLPRIKPGSWTLLDPNLVLASRDCTSSFPNGEMTFNENHVSPPSRAYLKLWELFTVHGVRPRPGELCLDLGSSPGGWTWVLSELGARVISVDKAPLEASLTKREGVRYLKASAFSLKPAEVGAVDWLFSDIICAPERLLDLVNTWRASGLALNFACTIKFKGATDHLTTRAFEAIPGSRLIHLNHNKHELTWVNTNASDPLSRS